MKFQILNFLSFFCLFALGSCFAGILHFSTDVSYLFIHFVAAVVQLLSHAWLFASPWSAAHQAPLSFAISWSLFKLMSIKSVMPSNQLILCRSLLFLPSVFPSIRVFSNESALHIRWPKYQSFQWIFIQYWFPLGLTGLISLQSKELSRVFSNISVRKHQFFGGQPSSWSKSHIHTWLLEKPCFD